MNYRIARNGTEIATADEQQIKAGLESGLYSASDHVWCEGMSGWKPVAEVLNMDEVDVAEETPERAVILSLIQSAVFIVVVVLVVVIILNVIARNK